jgi:hypothetical protein
MSTATSIPAGRSGRAPRCPTSRPASALWRQLTLVVYMAGNKTTDADSTHHRRRQQGRHARCRQHGDHHHRHTAALPLGIPRIDQGDKESRHLDAAGQGDAIEISPWVTRQRKVPSAGRFWALHGKPRSNDTTRRHSLAIDRKARGSTRPGRPARYGCSGFRSLTACGHCGRLRQSPSGAIQPGSHDGPLPELHNPH